MASISDSVRCMEAADLAYARMDVDGMVAHLSAAIQGFTACGERRRARCCAAIC